MHDLKQLTDAIAVKAGSRPAFVFDFAADELVWANTSGLGLWRVRTVEALRSISLWRRMLATPAERLVTRCQRLRRDDEDVANLVMFDGEGQPESLWRCHLTGLMDDGSMTLFTVMAPGDGLSQPFRRDTPEGKLLSALLGDSTLEMGLKDQHGRYLLMSEYAAGLAGMTADEMRGRTAADLYPPDAAAAIVTADAAVIRSGRGVATEVASGPEHGNRVYWALKFPVYDQHGQVCGTAGLATDITRVKQMQRALEASQAAARDANTKLVGGIAHEFNNMLTVILGYASLAADAEPDQATRYLRHVVDAGENARDLVYQLMAYTQTSASRPRRLDALPQLQQCVTRLRGQLRVSIALDVIDTGATEITMDPAQLDRCVTELIRNAARASGDGGTVRLQVRSADLSSTTCNACQLRFEGRGLLLSVHDTGPGIAPEVMPRVFDPFYTTQPVGEGRGLGLSVVHGMVHSAGGHITLGGSSSGGCAVTVWLPLPLEPEQ